MSKNAIILCSSYNYLLGLHAILNAIEYYGIDADVHIGTNEDLIGYINYAKTKFSYNITIHNVTSLGGHTSYDDADFVWGKYKIADLIKDDYEGIMHNDCDCMIVNDVTPYIEFAGKTDRILITSNVQCGAKFDRIKFAQTEKEIEDLCIGHTVKNFVWFYNGKTHTDVIQKLWEERNNPRLITNSMLETYFFNRVVHDLGKDNLVVPLPGSLWQSDDYLHKHPISMELHGRYKIVNCLRDELYVIHNRCWNTHLEQQTMRYLHPEKDKVMYNNAVNVTTTTKSIFTFLSNYKFTLEEARNISPYYNSIINLFLGPTN